MEILRCRLVCFGITGERRSRGQRSERIQQARCPAVEPPLHIVGRGGIAVYRCAIVSPESADRRGGCGDLTAPVLRVTPIGFVFCQFTLRGPARCAEPSPPLQSATRTKPGFCYVTHWHTSHFKSVISLLSDLAERGRFASSRSGGASVFAFAFSVVGFHGVGTGIARAG